MKRSLKIKIFTLICMLLITVCTITNNAAIVSDNDGSAFVTKAEFDALKGNFSKQIDDYNTSIDNKIDGSIAAYLAGINLSTAPTNSFEKIKESVSMVIFKNSVNSTDDRIDGTLNFTLYRQYYQDRYSGLDIAEKMWPSGAPSASYIYYTWCAFLVNSGTGGSASDQNAATYVAIATKASWSGNGQARLVWYDGPGTSGSWGGFGTQSITGSKVVKGTSTKDVKVDKDAKIYRYRKTPIGRLVILDYCSSYKPIEQISAFAHSYIDYKKNFKDNYTGTNLQKDETVLSLTIPFIDKLGESGTGTQYADDDNDADAKVDYKVFNYIATVADDPLAGDETTIWGKTVGNDIYAIEENSKFEDAGEQTLAASESASTLLADDYSLPSGVSTKDVTLSGVTTKYHEVKQTPIYQNIEYFSNDYVSTVAGETIYHGEGIPIAEVPQEGKIKVKIKFKNYDGSNNKIKYALADGKFKGGDNLSTGAKYLLDWKEIDCDAEVIEENTVSLSDKGTIWLNCYSSADGVDVVVDTVEVKLG